MRIGKLFLGRSWCNGRRDEAVIASWTRKDGYWRWAIYWHRPDRWLCLPSFGPSMAAGKKYFIGGHGGAWLELPLCGLWSISIQPRY